MNARYLMGTINTNPATTDGQRDEMEIRARKKPAPIPAPTTRPGLDIASVNGRTATVLIHSAKAGQSGKPKGVLGAYLYSFVGEQYPSDPAAWAFQGSTTKTVHDIVFPDSVPNGAQVWITATWFNNKTQTGPLAVPIATNLQGGLSRAA